MTSRALTFKQVRDTGIDLRPYVWDPLPDSSWSGRLEHKVWGDAPAGLLNCFFSCLETGRRYKLAAFPSRNTPGKERWYAPRDSSIDMSREPTGRIYQLTTGVGSRGKPAWFSAKRLQHGDAE